MEKSMGLDGVELVMEVEETFGIEIEDKDAEKLAIVGEMYQYICDRCKPSEANSCATQKAFYRLRNAFGDILKINKKKICPKTRIEDITRAMPNKDLWKHLSEKTTLVLPILKFPTWIVMLITFAGLTGGLLLSYQVMRLFSSHETLSFGFISWGILWALILWVFLSRILTKLAAPLRIIISSNCQTVGGLSKESVILNVKHFEPLSKQEIWDILVKVISDQLGIKEDVIKPESNFVRDFEVG